MYGKTIAEMREITLEAARRVRAGEPQVEVARALGLPPSTLATWARRGGWRRKDLIAVRDVARGEMILGLIDQVTAQEREKQEADTAKLRAALDASKAELESMTSSGQMAGGLAQGQVPADKLAMAMAETLLRQGQLEEADRAVRLATRFTEFEKATGSREEAKWREERERLTKWWAEKQTDYHKLHAMIEVTMNQMAASQALEDSRSADQCCPKCNRRMDFWPEEVERPQEVESGESGAVEPAVESDDKFEAGKPALEFGDESGAGDPDAGMDGGCHPNWKKDANGSWYWDGPPGQ